MGHVTKNVGGIYENRKTFDMPGNQFEVVPKSIQKDAVAFLNAQLFTTPKWYILSKINPENGAEVIKAMQDATLSSLMTGERIVRLLETSTASKDIYSVDELMSDLNKGIFSELKSKISIDMYRRNLQKLYVTKPLWTLSPQILFGRLKVCEVKM